MEKKTRNFIIITSVIFASFLFGSLVTAAGPEDSNLLEEVWEAIFGLEGDVELHDDRLIYLEASYGFYERLAEIEEEFEEQITELEEQIEILQDEVENTQASLLDPVYDTGWIEDDDERWEPNTGESGTFMSIPVVIEDFENKHVTMMGNYGNYAYHQYQIGGDRWFSTSDAWRGAYWYYDIGEDKLIIARNDDFLWQRIRLIVWELPPTT